MSMLQLTGQIYFGYGASSGSVKLHQVIFKKATINLLEGATAPSGSCQWVMPVAHCNDEQQIFLLITTFG